MTSDAKADPAQAIRRAASAATLRSLARTTLQSRDVLWTRKGGLEGAAEGRITDDTGDSDKGSPEYEGEEITAGGLYDGVRL